MNKTVYYALSLVIFVAAIWLRLDIANYNNESNDPHMPVVRFIMRYDTLPHKDDCWECFQPKLFHYVSAQILKALRLVRNVDADAQRAALQLLNAFAGVVTLGVTWFFLQNQAEVKEEARLLTFGLLAFNPQWIGINAQVTNDTFLILFCSLAIFSASLFLKNNQRFIYYFFVILFSILAVLTKTNGWVMVLAITISFFIWALRLNVRPVRSLAYAAFFPFLVLGVSTLSPLTQYVENYQTYGSPFVLNIEKKPAPLLFEHTEKGDAGILSIQDGFFTFKFIDLLKNPYTSVQDVVDASSHRTSLWTRLYASANSLHFESFPPGWREYSNTALNVSRGIFMLALLPFGLLLMSAIIEVKNTIKALFAKEEGPLINVSYGLFILVFLGYLSFLSLYAYQYRMYNVIKAVFVFPGLLAFTFFFLRATNGLFTNPKNTTWFKYAFIGLTALLILFYISDVMILHRQLLQNPSGIETILQRLDIAWN